MARLHAILAALLLAVMIGGASAQPAPPRIDAERPPVEEVDPRRLLPVEDRGRPFELLGLDEGSRLRAAVEEVAWEARRRLVENAGVAWRGTAIIVWVDSESEFQRRTGFQPHHVSAAANPRSMTIHLNAGAWRRADRATQIEVMAHEMAHLLLGSLPAGRDRPLPLWAEEGLAVRLSGEGTWRRGFALVRAQAGNALPRAEELLREFPRDPARQELAYAYSARAIIEVARKFGDESGDPGIIMLRLAHPDSALSTRELLWDKEFAAAIDDAVRAGLGSPARNMIVLATSATAIWFVVMLLAFAAIRRKRAKRRALAAREAAEEPWAESLTQQDIAEVWGEGEDAWKSDDPEDELPWDRWERIKDQ